ADVAIARHLTAGRKKRFPSFDDRPVAATALALQGAADRAFVMGGAVAGALRGLPGARARVERLMDICDQAPAEGAPRALVLVPVEQILCELLGSRHEIGRAHV